MGKYITMCPHGLGEAALAGHLLLDLLQGGAGVGILVQVALGLVEHVNRAASFSSGPQRVWFFAPFSDIPLIHANCNFIP